MNSPCMSEGKYRKKYPKPYINKTYTREDGYLKTKDNSEK